MFADNGIGFGRAAPRLFVLARLHDQDRAIPAIRYRIPIQVRTEERKVILEITVARLDARGVKTDRKINLFAAIAVGLGTVRDTNTGIGKAVLIAFK